MDLEERIRQAEKDLNDALGHVRELEIARRQVLDLLDDLRVYRNLLALQPYGVRPARNPRLPVPAQERRRLPLADQQALPTPPPHRPPTRVLMPRNEHGQFVPVVRRKR